MAQNALNRSSNRRKNFEYLVRQESSNTVFADKIEMSKSVLSQILNSPERKISNLTARKIEDKLNLGVGWMDKTHDFEKYISSSCDLSKQIGLRLKQERESRCLTQEEMGMIGGVKKGAQVNFEKGVRSPSANYLAAIATLGVDVLYVLTGKRAIENKDANINQRESCLGVDIVLIVDSETLSGDAPDGENGIENICLPMTLPALLPIGSDLVLNAPDDWLDNSIYVKITGYKFCQRTSLVTAYFEFDNQDSLFPKTNDYIVHDFLKIGWKKMQND